MRNGNGSSVAQAGRVRQRASWLVDNDLDSTKPCRQSHAKIGLTESTKGIVPSVVVVISDSCFVYLLGFSPS